MLLTRLVDLFMEPEAQCQQKAADLISRYPGLQDDSGPLQRMADLQALFGCP